MKHFIEGLKERFSSQRAVPRILLIDDDQDVLEYLKISLEEKKRYEVIMTTSGREGVAMAKWRSPDFIMLDWEMPNISGIQVLHLLDKKGILEEIPVCVLTSDTSFDTFELATYRGAVDVLTKPIKMAKILKFIKPHLYDQTISLPKSQYGSLCPTLASCVKSPTNP